MQSNYYYLYSSLPDISFNVGYDYSQLSYLFDEVYESLSEEDQLYMRYIRYPIDNQNLINLIEKSSAEFFPNGNYTESELKYEIAALDTIPEYMQKFLEMFREFPIELSGHGNINRINPFFYDSTMQLQNDFLKQWFIFDRDLKNVLTAIECRKHNEPIEKRDMPRIGQKMGQRLIGEYEISETLLQSKSLDYSLTGILPWMTRVLNLNSANPNDFENQLISLQIEFIDQLTSEQMFCVDTILAFMLKLNIFTRLSRFDEHAGKKYFDRTLEQTTTLVKKVFTL